MGSIDAFSMWKRTSFTRRASVLDQAANILEDKSELYAQLMATEMGKPLSQGVGEAKKCAWVCRYYAEHGERYLTPSPRKSDASDSFIYYAPLGPILAVMPWNFPFWQVFRHAAPGIMAGNTIVMKHAPNTPQCALAIEELLLEAGLPQSVLQNVFFKNNQVAWSIADSRIAGVTITGSTTAGQAIATAAGKALKKSVLELGGSDPFIVFADGDIKEAAQAAVASRCLNSGQSCIAAKRFLIQDSVYNDFRDRFVDLMKKQVVGDPTKEGTEIGPLARKDLQETLHAQVKQSIEEGAQVLCGGTIPDGDGFFYTPTVLENAPPDSPARTEELFGPVATLIPFKSVDEACAIANETDYGLGASVWTKEHSLAMEMVEELDTGSVFINGMVKSVPGLPFGGIKKSGYGRELSYEGILEFVNQKTVWMK